MSRRRRGTIQELREAVQSLPRVTRVAMLEGLDAGPIIAGAYTSGDGICPMLAAHRAGGRCRAAFFADAWDRFVFRDGRGSHGSARQVSERELRILRVHLEASLLDDDLTDASRATPLQQPRQQRRQPRQPGYDERETGLVHLLAAAAGGPSERGHDRAEPVNA